MYKIWHVIMIINCLYTSIVYTIYTAIEFPEIDTYEFWLLVF